MRTVCLDVLFFFKQKTAYEMRISDWSSDVCSSDLHPDRFFQMGMAEQLLMASAGGMAKEGFVPFATTYAVFATRRAYDFIHQVIAEEHLNVKICCALPGLTTGYGPKIGRASCRERVCHDV